MSYKSGIRDCLTISPKEILLEGGNFEDSGQAVILGDR